MVTITVALLCPCCGSGGGDGTDLASVQTRSVCALTCLSLAAYTALADVDPCSSECGLETSQKLDSASLSEKARRETPLFHLPLDDPADYTWGGERWRHVFDKG